MPLNGIGALGIESFRPEKLQHGRAHQIEVRLGGGEVIVHRDISAGLDEGLGKQVLGSASLVSRQQILVAENLLHRIRQLVKALRAGIGVVGQQHGGLLIVAHGIGAAVGQHVQKNVAGTKKKCVVARFLHCLEPLAGRGQSNLLHNADFVHLDGNFSAIRQTNTHEFTNHLWI